MRVLGRLFRLPADSMEDQEPDFRAVLKHPSQNAKARGMIRAGGRRVPIQVAGDPHWQTIGFPRLSLGLVARLIE